MPDPSHRPYDPMTIIRPHAKPALWWLFPWSYARQLHRNCNALRALSDKADFIVDLQQRVIEDQAAEIRHLKLRIADQNDAIIRGTAITPDAYPHE